jgi:hypothetical protein
MPPFFLDTDPAPLNDPTQQVAKKKSKKGAKNDDKPKPKPFDPVDEYRALLDLTEDRSASSRRRKNLLSSAAEEDVYSDLMSRERRVLDTVDRVVNDAIETRRNRSSSSLSGMPVHEVAMRTMGAVRSLWDDLINAASLEDVVTALIDPSRVLFLGIAIVALAVLMAIVLAMSNSA